MNGNTMNNCGFDPQGICDPWNSGSTNIMGYNDPQNSLTMCQWKCVYNYVVNNTPAYVEDYCDKVTNTTLTIPTGTNETWDVLKLVTDQTVLVEDGASLTIRCETRMPPAGKIVVKPNGKLIIDGAKITNLCNDERWEGIIVIGNKWQHQYLVNNYRYQGYLRIMNGALLENSIYAVRSFDPANPYNTGGGVVIATDAQFLNNIVGVNMTHYQNFNYLTGQPTGDISYFNNCRFTVDANFPGNISQFQAMASLSQVSGIEFRGCRFSNEFPHSGLTYAGQKRFGIFASDAEFQVTGLCLGNTYPCSNYQRSRFYGFDAAIHTGKFGSIRPFRVTMTDFVDNARGINAYKVDNIYVADNTFKVGMDLPLGNGNDFTGITLYRCTGYKIEENSMEPTAGNIAGGAQTIGIFTLHSWNDPNEIYKNSFSGLKYGNLSNGRNKNIFVPDIGLQYLCNSNASNAFDFAVPDEEGTGLGIAGNQGSSNLAAGNSFTTQAYDPLSEVNFLNRESFINYFVPPAPVNYTSSTISLSTAPDNQCFSRLPNDKEGKLSQNEKQQFAQDFTNTTDAKTRTYSANMLVRDFLIDSAGIDLASARTWLSNKGGLESYFAIVDSWLQEDSTAVASQVLQSIPNLFNLQGEDTLEYQYFQSLKSLQINALDNDQNNEQLVGNHESTIRSIAEAGHYYASVQAQNLINSVKGLEYEPDMLLPSPQQQGMMAPLPGNFNTMESETVFLDAIPNPAKSRTVFHYRLPETIEVAQIIVTSMDGRTIKMIDVEGTFGQVEWDTKGVTEGIYIYRLITGNEAIETKRLVIIK